jgi:hypothetical protein
LTLHRHLFEYELPAADNLLPSTDAGGGGNSLVVAHFIEVRLAHLWLSSGLFFVFSF